MEPAPTTERPTWPDPRRDPANEELPPRRPLRRPTRPGRGSGICGATVPDLRLPEHATSVGGIDQAGGPRRIRSRIAASGPRQCEMGSIHQVTPASANRRPDHGPPHLRRRRSRRRTRHRTAHHRLGTAGYSEPGRGSPPAARPGAPRTATDERRRIGPPAGTAPDDRATRHPPRWAPGTAPARQHLDPAEAVMRPGVVERLTGPQPGQYVEALIELGGAHPRRRSPHRSRRTPGPGGRRARRPA